MIDTPSLLMMLSVLAVGTSIVFAIEQTRHLVRIKVRHKF